MKAHFSKYPKIWGLKTTDRSIDHRRVPNLRTFFARKGWSVPITENAADYEPGDLVTWNLSDSIPPHWHRFRPENGGRHAADHS